MKELILCVGLVCAVAGCTNVGGLDGRLGAGIRYSSYGPPHDPGSRYWADTARDMADMFPHAVPQVVWIVGTREGSGTHLNFPGQSDDPHIIFSESDANEQVLRLFDRMRGQVWLQVEPGQASVETLIDILLERYGDHRCVVGVGVDVEWFGADDKGIGTPVSDDVANSWVAAVREHGTGYGLFLKHWLISHMPPTARDGILFIDDSQDLSSLDAMVSEFKEWGAAFGAAPVGFQYGYASDRGWWQELDNPPADIGNALLRAIPNTRALYWVDFTVFEVFPP